MLLEMHTCVWYLNLSLTFTVNMVSLSTFINVYCKEETALSLLQKVLVKQSLMETTLIPVRKMPLET
jgi:hypothetical protein